MDYINFTEEEKERAGAVNLVGFLERQGEELEPSGSEWRWKRHDSVTVRDNTWYRHSCKYGGSPIQFLQEFYDMTYVEAMTCLLGGGYPSVTRESGQGRCQTKTKKTFHLPEENQDMKRVLGYLAQKRFIDYGILMAFVKTGSIYEEKKRHNAVFVGFNNQGEACHAHMKGTYSNGESFRLNVEGSDSAYGFGHCGIGIRLYVFESAIDLLSFLTLYPCKWREQSYICLDGLSEHAMLQVLKSHPQIKEVILCLDHDPAGIEGCYRLKELLGKQGHDKVTRLVSRNKDWNEDLKEVHGVQPVPAREHPGLVSFRNLCIWLKGLPEIDDTEEISRKKIESAYHHLSILLKRQEMYREDHDKEILMCLEEMAAAGFQLLWAGHKGQTPCTKEQLAGSLFRSYQPHKDRGNMRKKMEGLKKTVEAMGNINMAYRTGKCNMNQWRDTCIQFVQACLRLHVQLTITQKEQQLEIGKPTQALTSVQG